MIDTYDCAFLSFVVGRKYIFVEDDNNYHKGAIVEIASINTEDNSHPVRFHGISGYVWGYDEEKLKDARRQYPHGCFSINKKELYKLKEYNEGWDW